MDDKYYVALQYVGVQGIPFSQVKTSGQEDQFSTRLMNLLLRSNKDDLCANIDDEE